MLPLLPAYLETLRSWTYWRSRSFLFFPPSVGESLRMTAGITSYLWKCRTSVQLNSSHLFQCNLFSSMCWSISGAGCEQDKGGVKTDFVFVFNKWSLGNAGKSLVSCYREKKKKLTPSKPNSSKMSKSTKYTQMSYTAQKYERRGALNEWPGIALSSIFCMFPIM